MSLRMLLGLLIGVAATAAVLWGTGIPLGVPGEWTWNRAEITAEYAVDAILGTGIAVVVCAVYLAFVHVSARRIAESSGAGLTGRLSLLTLLGMAVLWGFESAQPGEYPAVKSAWVLYDRGASGYFFEAAHSKQDTAAFLSSYEAKMAEGDVLHIGTHPPGLILLHRGLLRLCRASPAVTDIVLSVQPASVAEAFDVLERTVRSTPEPLPDSDRAALWLAVLLTHLVAAGSVIPLFFLVRMDWGAKRAWLTAALWPLIPAVAVFLPKSDALLPCFGLLFLWCWRSAVRRGSFWRAAFAGLLMWAGLLFSLAMLPVALFAVALTIGETFARDAASGGDTADLKALSRPAVRNGLLAATAILAFLAATGVFYAATQANLIGIWIWNYRNHAAFYAQPSYPRTYWKWLGVNALELVLAVGWPVILPAGVGVLRVLKSRELWGTRRHAPVLATLFVVGLLWLSGKNMGEAARLWLFLFPWILWMTAGCWRLPTEETAKTARHHIPWPVIAAFQSATCLLTVLQVRGFHFAGS